MTPSFGCTVIASLIGAAILGCTCVTNKLEREKKVVYTPNSGVENPNFNKLFSNNQNDPQVLRL